MKNIIPNINFFTLLGACLLLFLPWTLVQCNGEAVGTQNGLQVAFGGFSSSPRFESMANQEESEDESDSELAFAYLTVASIVALLLGVVSAGLCYFKNTRSTKEAGLLACLAFGCIFAQTLVGSPIEREVATMYEDEDPAEDNMERAMRSAINFDVTYTNWFYLYLLCLALPAGLYLRSKVQKDKTPANSESTVDDR
ncbi:MAG: hypothetical protein ACPGYV_02850 [Phycisphaeraceae bacterium]